MKNFQVFTILKNRLKDYENVERISKKISQSLNERSKYPKSSSNYSKITSAIRSEIGKLNNTIISLERGLNESNV
jgi:hypothetical protein